MKLFFIILGIILTLVSAAFIAAMVWLSAESEKGGAKAVFIKSGFLTGDDGQEKFFGKGEILTGWILDGYFHFAVQIVFDNETHYKVPLDAGIIEII